MIDSGLELGLAMILGSWIEVLACVGTSVGFATTSRRHAEFIYSRIRLIVPILADNNYPIGRSGLG
jgi:hypothetical protein